MPGLSLKLGAAVVVGCLVLSAPPAALAEPPPAMAGRADVTGSPFVAAEVAGSNGAWVLTWRLRHHGPVSADISADRGKTWQPVAKSVRTGRLNVPAQPGEPHPWFRLRFGGDAVVIAARSLDVPSVANMRDLGGYRTESGEWVRMGRIYRSSALTLAAADRPLADSLGIRDVYDLRTAAEAAQTPDVVPTGAVRELHDVLGTGVSGPAATTPDAAAETMRALERVFVDDPASRAAFGEVITDLATRTGAQLFHCTGGKDRTGWAAAVVLTLLGVDKDTVMTDYLLSNAYVLESPGTQAYLSSLNAADRALAEAFIRVEPSYLQAGLDEVAAKYGSMYRYAVDGLGVSPGTVEQLRAGLIEAPR